MIAAEAPNMMIMLPRGLARTAAYLKVRAALADTFGGQLYASLGGEVVADVAWGSGGVDVAVTDLVQWASSTKVVPAIAFGQVWEAGLVDLEDPVERFIPEYAQNGKAGITLWHLLTHTSGIVDQHPHAFVTHERDEVLALCCAAGLKPGWQRGRQASYGGSGPFLIGEVVARVDGRSFDRYVREAIFEPLGMTDCWVGMPTEEFHRVAPRIRHRYIPTRDGGIVADAVWTARENIHRASAGGGGIGPVRELARAYEMLLGDGARDGVRLLSPQTVAAITAAHRVGMGVDVFRGRVLDLGLFLYRDSKYARPDDPAGMYGRWSSPRTCGHPGAGCMNAFADPECGLAVAMYLPGPGGGAVGGGATSELATALYEDLGLAPAEQQDSQTG